MELLKLLLFAALAAGAASATHREELFIRPLPHSKSALAHFHFTTEEPATATGSESLYPKVIRQILTKYEAASIHLSFAVGEYDEARHGPPSQSQHQGVAETFHAPFGARLQVEFLGGNNDGVMDRWRGVTSELGGVFSASLNQMDETTITRTLDRGAAREFGMTSIENATVETTFFQANLAREELCTENLTPWLKMLPCRGHAGLGTVIDPIRILSGQYAMFAVSASRGVGSQAWRFDQHLTTIQGFGSNKQAPTSLKSLLLDNATKGPHAVMACPLADTSVITTESTGVETIDLKTSRESVSTSEAWIFHEPSTKIKPQSIASVHRFQTGFGQVHGGIAVRLENRHPSCAMTVTYNDVTPWYLRLYFHTFQSRVESLSTEGRALEATPVFSFFPAELRGRPNQFSVQINLPPQSALLLSVQFEKVFIRLSEHPPDANRGFDIPPGVATFTSRACDVAVSRVVYSEPLLVAIPTPDFSMPYNVITLTSTVVAFFVGSMLNTLLRKAPRIKRILADSPKP